MQSSIQLNRTGTTRIDNAHNSKSVALQLSVKGSGTLHACIVGFYTEDGQNITRRDLFFYTPGFMMADTLPARQTDFDISEFSYCELEILSAQLSPEDVVMLDYAFAS